MDILLCHSYFLNEDEVERQIMKPYPPLGLLYISAHLEAGGYRVGVLDTTFLSVDEGIRAVTDSVAPIVGIYTNMMTRPHVLKLVAAAKERHAFVILGGPEAVNYPDEYLARGADVIVSGEGEAALEELIPHLQQTGPSQLENIQGIIFQDKHGNLARTEARPPIKDLNAQPLPARERIDLERYLTTWEKHHGVRSISMITARGCPYTCRWCSHSVFGFGHRRRSPQNVADEIDALTRAYAPDQIWYADDVFTMNPKWLSKFADELENRGLGLPFEAISREDRLNEDVVRGLKRLGCSKLWVGAESGSQSVLNSMDRRTDAERMREVISLLKDYGIQTGTFIMVGYEGETWSDLNETRSHLVRSLPDEVLTTLAYPIKGTPYFEDVKSRVKLDRDWAKASDRDYVITGRRTRKFYGYAQRWIQNEVKLARAVKGGSVLGFGTLKSAIKAKRDRLGMYMTRHQREGAS